MENFELQVKKIISRQLGKSVLEAKNSSSFSEDLGADSLDSASLLLALEDELGIEISDQEAVKIKTIQDAIDFCSKNIKNK
jgi:acyl carrier protein